MESFVYLLLLLTSIAGLTVAIERALALRWRKVVPPEVEAVVENCRTRAEVPGLRRVCERHPAPLSRLLLAGLDHLDWSRSDVEDSIQTRARHEVVKLGRGLVVLEVIVGVAPLLGLVGTIAGMMELFHGLGAGGMPDPVRLAGGIGLILKVTLFGLLIAIPALVTWGYFTRKVEVLTVEMEHLCAEFVRRQFQEGRKE